MESDEKIVIEVDDQDLLNQGDKKNAIRVLTFCLGGENYCIDINHAKEVVRLPEITRVPNTPAFIVGIINLRGEVLSVLDIHYFFGLEKKGKPQDARLIVTDVVGDSLGIMVDRIKDAIDIDQLSIQPPLAILKGNLSAYTKGQIQLGGEIYILLDIYNILNCDEIKNLRKGNV